MFDGTKKKVKSLVSQKYNYFCVQNCYYTCSAILCLHSEVEGNSTNVLSSWHCNIDTQFHLSTSFINYVYTPLKSYRHNCKNSNKLKGIMAYSSTPYVGMAQT